MGDTRSDIMAPMCAVCQEPMLDDMCSTSCGHVYHQSCLDPWVRRGNHTCPDCRGELEYVLPLYISLKLDPSALSGTDVETCNDISKLRTFCKVLLGEVENRKNKAKLQRQALEAKISQQENTRKALVGKLNSLQLNLEEHKMDLKELVEKLDTEVATRVRVETEYSTLQKQVATARYLENPSLDFAQDSPETLFLTNDVNQLKNMVLVQHRAACHSKKEYEKLYESNSSLKIDHVKLTANHTAVLEKLEKLKAKRRADREYLRSLPEFQGYAKNEATQPKKKAKVGKADNKFIQLKGKLLREATHTREKIIPERSWSSLSTSIAPRGVKRSSLSSGRAPVVKRDTARFIKSGLNHLGERTQFRL
mmetsp:Transcript_34645/g.55381  ORF Transcript_34645/g.55381 Transcript_34645/m.55381 type:complete len:365 (-) Transcript_34645:3469-4563(-)